MERQKTVNTRLFTYNVIFFTFLFLSITSIVFGQNPYTQTGVASYYGKEFHGRKTACGEKYCMDSMTAAHKTLPFNTWVKVTNLSNNKSVIVRINDRGPYSHKRIIDLSYGAAKDIGMIQSGVARVKIEVIDHKKHKKSDTDNHIASDKDQKKSENSENSEKVEKREIKIEYYNHSHKKIHPQGYCVQLGSYKEKAHGVENLAKFNKQLKEPVYLEVYQENETLYKVVAGVFENEQQAERYMEQLKHKGIEGFVRKY